MIALYKNQLFYLYTKLFYFSLSHTSSDNMCMIDMIHAITASDKAYQLLARGRWFSLGTSASSTTKTGRHDIAEILLKVALNTIKSSNQQMIKRYISRRIGARRVRVVDNPTT
jgi:hypothetical protein